MGSEAMEPDTPDAWTTDASPQLLGVAELLGVAMWLTSVGDAVSETGVDATAVCVVKGLPVRLGVAPPPPPGGK